MYQHAPTLDMHTGHDEDEQIECNIHKKNSFLMENGASSPLLIHPPTLDSARTYVAYHRFYRLVCVCLATTTYQYIDQSITNRNIYTSADINLMSPYHTYLY